MKNKIAWVKGYNDATTLPLPSAKVIDISLANIDNEDEAYQLGVEFARMWGEVEGEDIEGSDIHNGNNAKPKTPGRVGL